MAFSEYLTVLPNGKNSPWLIYTTHSKTHVGWPILQSETVEIQNIWHSGLLLRFTYGELTDDFERVITKVHKYCPQADDEQIEALRGFLREFMVVTKSDYANRKRDKKRR